MDDVSERSERVGDALRAAMAAGDPEVLRRVLSPDVRWGDDGHPRSCRGPDEVVATMRRALDLGVAARLGEVVAGPRAVLAELVVEFPGQDPLVRYQVYDVADGLVTEIRGFDDAADARAAAGLGPTA